MSDVIGFVKGHGTQNDFVVLPDLDDDLELTPGLVAAICDRRAGIGGDGVLRVVRRDGGWFMDYRNADGSIAETCGNGLRVFARYLLTAGLVAPGEFVVATRAGERLVAATGIDADIAVEMGVPVDLPPAAVAVGGRRFEAVGVSMGNPHLVVLDQLGAVDLAGLDLTAVPMLDPATAYPGGANVEFVLRAGPRSIELRVHERGVGETRSCGTGACAAAVAAMTAVAERTSYDVDVPGGRLRVTWRPDGQVVLAGPAVLVGSGEIQVQALRAACHDGASVPE